MFRILLMLGYIIGLMPFKGSSGGRLLAALSAMVRTGMSGTLPVIVPLRSGWNI